MVSDSSCTATAIFTGIKVNQFTGGVDTTVDRYDCDAAMNKNSHLKSVLAWAQEAGKATGNKIKYNA